MIFPQEAVAVEPQATEEVKVEEVAVEAEEQPKPEEPFEGSKKEANALERKRKQLEQARRETEQERRANIELLNRLEKLEKSVNPERTAEGVPLTLANGEPNPDAYTDYQKYLDDRFDWRLAQREAAKTKETEQKQPEQADPQLKAWIDERAAAVDAQAEEFIKMNPEAATVFEENQHFIQECAAENPQLLRLFLAADKPEVAYFNLAKEGKLDALLTMPLAKAAMEIGRAQVAIPKPQTLAPKPLSTSRGSVAGEKDPSTMTDAEFNAWRRKSIARKRTY